MHAKIITVSTPAHAFIANELAREILEHTNHKLLIYDLGLECEGSFGTREFFKSCFNKIKFIIHALHNLADNSYLIYLDTDICVFKNVAEEMRKELGEYDICFQRDGKSSHCAGMFICRKNDSTTQFFENVLVALCSDEEYYTSQASDQTAINEMLPHSNLRYSMLSSRFTTYGNIAQELWTPSSPKFKLDADVVAFHANFTIGLQNKAELLNRVRNPDAYNTPAST
jgi:lipopolysaccharide biosynthesis glycosyltransferase